jgi:hypothetical protein
VKAAAETPLETVRAAIADWLERLKAFVVEGAIILSEIVINKHLN